MAITGAVVFLPISSPATEETFNMLQIGSQTFQNVTVTTKSKNYIFILHSGGMTNIKVSDMPDDLREKLGYAVAPPPKVETNSASAWAKKAVAKMETPQVKQVQSQLLRAWETGPVSKIQFPPMTPRLIVAAAGLVLALYFLHCYCLMLICRKTGNEPGVLVWLPVLQLFPMLRAASMSSWWFIAFFIPVLNLVGHVLWCVKIVEARSKTIPLLILLLLPVTSFFAVLYLAFSEGRSAPVKKEVRRVEIMTLETA
jgi:hypothetical protein